MPKSLACIPEQMEQTRRLPVPFNRQRRSTGQGHLVPKLTTDSGRGFLRLPGLSPVEFGMIGFLGQPITTSDILERWTDSAPLPIDRAEAALTIDAYLRQVQAFKVGTIIEITYGPGGFLVTMVAQTPHFEGPTLP